jgi:hypothetical protein
MSELRFTDRPPPPEVLAEYANWVHARGEEGRRGQDETTIKPQRRQTRIDDDTEYTAAAVWLADDTETIGLLWLSAGHAIGITVYEGEAVWRLYAGRAGGLWRPLSPVAPGRLPLRYCTRLRYERQPLRGVVAADGQRSEWVLGGE